MEQYICCIWGRLKTWNPKIPRFIIIFPIKFASIIEVEYPILRQNPSLATSLGVLRSNIQGSASGSTSAPLFVWFQVAPSMASLEDLKVRIKWICFGIFKLIPKNGRHHETPKHIEAGSNHIKYSTHTPMTSRLSDRVGLHPSDWRHAAKITGAWERPGRDSGGYKEREGLIESDSPYVL